MYNWWIFWNEMVKICAMYATFLYIWVFYGVNAGKSSAASWSAWDIPAFEVSFPNQGSLQPSC
jgi:hypothetical protein